MKKPSKRPKNNSTKNKPAPLEELPQADQLLAVVRKQIVALFCDERGEPYARLKTVAGLQIIRLNSKDFQRWVGSVVWAAQKKVIAKETIGNLVRTLEGIACHAEASHPLFVRSAQSGSDFWLDWNGMQAIQILTDEWRVTDPPILFRPNKILQALPEPRSAGDIRRIFDFINLPDESERLLLLSYLITSCVPDIAMPIVIVHGPHGAAKSTFLRLLKQLIDPSILELLGTVRDQGELALQAHQNRLLCFDNLTYLPDWLSDCFCRIVTGETFAKRALYTDEDTHVLSYRRLLGINGINLVATRPDLLDRAVLFELVRIPEDRRISETALLKRFVGEAGDIFGGMLDALVRARSILPRLNFIKLPRMADFARWGTAAAIALGYAPDQFLEAYWRNIRQQTESVLENNPVAQAILRFLEIQNGQWSGDPTTLHRELAAVASELRIDPNGRDWPKAPNWLSRRLREIHPTLAAKGIVVEDNRSDDGRLIHLQRIEKNTDDADMSDGTVQYADNDGICGASEGQALAHDVGPTRV